MKKLLLLLILVFIASCAPKRVCGGSGGLRCVDNPHNQLKPEKNS